MVVSIKQALIKIDRVSDYIPVVSTITNLIDLFQKCVVLPLMEKTRIWNNHYYTHLQQKDFIRCIFLLIPGIGNLIFGIVDFLNRKWDNKEFVRNKVVQDGRTLENASNRLKNDREFVLAVIRQNPLALCHVSDRFKDDRDLVLAAVRQNGFALEFASDRLKDDREVVLAAVGQYGFTLEYASERLKNDREFVLDAVMQNGLALQYASDWQDDRDVVLAAVRQNGFALKFASVRLKNDRDLVLEAIHQVGASFIFAGAQLREDSGLILAVINKLDPQFGFLIQRVLEAQPDLMDIIDRFDFEPDSTHDFRSIRDAFYEQVETLIQEFFRDPRILRFAQLQQIQVINLLNEVERKYQNDLKALIKKSFIELHDNENLVRMLSKDNTVEDGRYQLTTFSTTIEFAHYAQLQEIMSQEVTCPVEFRSHDLVDYNTRRKNILDAKERINQLNDQEKQILIEMLLKTSDFNMSVQNLTEERKKFIQQLFRDIGDSAGQLHQGNLLSEKYVNIAQLNQGNFNEAYGSNNLFNGFCQEASREIEARPSQVI